MHNPFRVHVFESTTQLDEILPNGPLWNESLLLFKVLDHTGQVSCVCQFQNNVQLVFFDEGRQVFDHVWVV